MREFEREIKMSTHSTTMNELVRRTLNTISTWDEDSEGNIRGPSIFMHMNVNDLSIELEAFLALDPQDELREELWEESLEDICELIEEYS